MQGNKVEKQILEALDLQKQNILNDEQMMKNTSDYWRGQLIATVNAITAVQKVLSNEDK